MTDDTIPARPVPASRVRAKLNRSRTTNDPLAVRASGNTRTGRRIRDLYRAMMAKIGSTDDVIIQADVLAAAELKVAAEDARSRLLAGEIVDPDHVVRLEGAAARAERKLAKYAVPAKPRTLAERLAERRMKS